MPRTAAIAAPARIVLAGVAAVVLGAACWLVAPGYLAQDPLDLRALYCAGSVANQGADPYLVEPLRSCELETARFAGVPQVPSLAISTPIPPYALPVLGMLARLDLRAATTLYLFLNVVAIVVTTIVLARLSGWPAISVLAALILSVGFANLRSGQIVAFAIVLLVVASELLVRNRIRAAAILVVLACFEPQLAIPAAASLFVRRRESRVVLIAGIAALVAIAQLTPGAHIVAYLMTVVPEQLASQTHNGLQFSATEILGRFGTPDAIALALGRAAYDIAAIVGIIIAPAIARRLSQPALLILIPVAAVTLGGPYEHIHHVAAALPAAIVVAARSSAMKPLATIAVSLLSIPWIALAELDVASGLVAAAAVTFAIFAGAGRDRRESFAAAALSCAPLALLHSPYIPWPAEPVVSAAALAAIPSDALASSSLGLYLKHLDDRGPWYIAARVPTWLGLALLAIAAARASGSKGPAQQ